MPGTLAAGQLVDPGAMAVLLSGTLSAGLSGLQPNAAAMGLVVIEGLRSLLIGEQVTWHGPQQQDWDSSMEVEAMIGVCLNPH